MPKFIELHTSYSEKAIINHEQITRIQRHSEDVNYSVIFFNNQGYIQVREDYNQLCKFLDDLIINS